MTKIPHTVYSKFLTEVKKSGVHFNRVADFVEAISMGEPLGRSIIKHDAHHDLDSCVLAAKVEADLGITSTFLFMGEHELAAYHGTQQFWRAVENISALGHEVGLHLDFHELILKYGCANLGIEALCNEFLKNAGVVVKSANLHGNTRLRLQYGSPKALIRARNHDVKPLRHKYPVAGQVFDHFVMKYSLQDFSDKFGIDYWLDPIIYHRGSVVPVRVFGSDNSGDIKIVKRKDRVIRISFAELDNKLDSQISEMLASSASQFLIHPQNIF